ncbi:MAG: leucyl aminopeptidase, partial [Candidatus Magasanikbacteria bacterium CG_4_9_14_0_2_um_filter_41_10]
MTAFSLAKEGQKADCLILPLFEDEGDKDIQRFGTVVSHVRGLKDFEGKKLQTSLLYTGEKETPRVLLIGLGKKKDLNVRTWKHAVGASVISLQGKKYTSLAMVIPDDVTKLFGTKKAGRQTVLAVGLASYAFDEHKSEKDARVEPLKHLAFLNISGNEKRAWQSGMEEGVILESAINETRHLANTPPTIMTPVFLAKAAQNVAKTFPSIKVSVLGKAEVKNLGMGCFLGVAQGSALPPQFIIMEYMAGKKTEKPTVLVGKGITFDSGGLSLKPSAYMTDMKFDMLGAATVLGTVRATAALALKKNIVALMPACENMPGGESYRPDDILVNMEGKTVEIGNTDAEGRLILCDALSYAKKYRPKEVIDFATLTGACMVALGNERSGLFSQEESMIEKMMKSSVETGEK